VLKSKCVKPVPCCMFDYEFCKRGGVCLILRSGSLYDVGICVVVFWCKRFSMDVVRSLDLLSCELFFGCEV
jgi:hypothetical protein